MKKIILILSSLVILSSCSSAFMAAKPNETLPAPVSVDPYKGNGTKMDYTLLARDYEAKYYKLSAQAAKYWESAKSIKYKSFTATGYSERMNYKSRYLAMQTKAETYRSKAMQAASEYQKYTRLSKKASN